jgi:hypothetical protein
MRWACSDERWRWDGRVAALMAVALALSGCSSAPSASDLTGSISNFFGSSSDRQTLVAAGTPAFDDADCPAVDIRVGASTLAVAAKTEQATANDVRYQLSFNQIARQCVVSGGTMMIKVGVQGRAVLGPAGSAGPVSVPLRYAVVKEGIEPKTIVTKFKRLAMAIAPGETNVGFKDIDEGLTFQMPPLVELQTYVVYVGFDDAGDKNEKKPPPKKTAPRR